MFLSFKFHIYLESSVSFSFCLFLNEFLWLPILVLNSVLQIPKYLSPCWLLPIKICCQLNKKCLMMNIFHLRDKHYSLGNYSFVCLCRSSSKSYSCAFWLVFLYYPCNCSLLLCYFYWISYGSDVSWYPFWPVLRFFWLRSFWHYCWKVD